MAYFIRKIQFGHGGLPAWVHDPGANLAPLAAVAEGLGWRTFMERGILFITQPDTPKNDRYFYLAISRDAVALCQWASGQSTDFYLDHGWRWADPNADALQRSLQLLIALRPFVATLPAPEVGK